MFPQVGKSPYSHVVVGAKRSPQSPSFAIAAVDTYDNVFQETGSVTEAGRSAAVTASPAPAASTHSNGEVNWYFVPGRSMGFSTTTAIDLAFVGPPAAPSPSPPPPNSPPGLCHADCPATVDASIALLDASRNEATSHGGTWCDGAADKPMSAHDDVSTADWYRFGGLAGFRMASSPPGISRCGTKYTGWLSTPHPSVGDAPKPGTVCFDGSSAANCVEVALCACSYDGGISATYTYKLPKPPTCDAAYCGTTEPMTSPPPPLLPAPPSSPKPPPSAPSVDGSVRLHFPTTPPPSPPSPVPLPLTLTFTLNQSSSPSLGLNPDLALPLTALT